jgi:hypothetical protein
MVDVEISKSYGNMNWSFFTLYIPSIKPTGFILLFCFLHGFAFTIGFIGIGLLSIIIFISSIMIL